MATQAAVLAGFTTTCLIEISIPENANVVAKNFLHIAAIVSICSNITCVSLSTITNMWGSGKALRGKDGSMDEAVEGINDERALIFRSFAFGLAGNLCTVLAACFITMEHPISLFASIIVLFTAWIIYSNATRIQRKFFIAEAIRLDDLTRFPTKHDPRSPINSKEITMHGENEGGSSNALRENGGRNRKSAFEMV
jgi:hypothetical protein